jgi:MFS family permease
VNAALARYRRALAAPHVLPLVASSVLARMPIGVLALALVLFLREHTGSYASAGTIAGLFAFADALSAPLQGRLVDRLGQTRVIVPLTFIHVAALGGVVAFGLSDASLVAVGACAALAGACVPPVGAALRPLWPGLMAGEGLLAAAYALDAILTEIVFIVGPAITAIVVASLSTAAALVASGVFALVGALWFASLEPSRAWRPSGDRGGGWGALASPGMRTLVLAMFPFGFCIGVMEVVLPAFGAEHGSESLPALLLGLQGVGSAIGGLWYGSSERRFGGLARAYLLLLAAIPVAFAAIALAQSVVTMVLLVALSGAVLAPLTIAENQVLQRIAPPGAITEAFTWVLMASILGVGAGSAVGGTLVDAGGWRVAMLAGAATAAVGAAAAFARRRTLQGVTPADSLAAWPAS